MLIAVIFASSTPVTGAWSSAICPCRREQPRLRLRRSPLRLRLPPVSSMPNRRPRMLILATRRRLRKPPVRDRPRKTPPPPRRASLQHRFCSPAVSTRGLWGETTSVGGAGRVKTATWDPVNASPVIVDARIKDWAALGSSLAGPQAVVKSKWPNKDSSAREV